MKEEQIKKVRMYLKVIGLSDEEINKQLSNEPLMEAYLSQVNSYEENMRHIMVGEMLKDDNIQVNQTSKSK